MSGYCIIHSFGPCDCSGDPLPQEGAALLDDVAKHFGQYVITMSTDDRDLLTLWAVHTHLVEETYTTPRLQIDSPLEGSGKTTVLDHMYRLAVAPMQMAGISSSALLVRALAGQIRTLLIDEADRTLRQDKPETDSGM